MRIYSSNEGSRDVESRLHAMRGDASRRADLSASILSRMAEQRPFADRRTLRLRRWGRLVGTAAAIGLAVCASIVAVQWSQIAPGLPGAKQRPIRQMVSNTVAGVRAGTKSIKEVPARLAFMVRSNSGEGRTDPEDAVVVRSLTSNLIVPMSTVLHVTPSMEVSETELGLAKRFLASGQRVLDTAERLASSLKPSGMGGVSGMGGETFADRLGRAVTGAPMGDGGPQ